MNRKVPKRKPLVWCALVIGAFAIIGAGAYAVHSDLGIDNPVHSKIVDENKHGNDYNSPYSPYVPYEDSEFIDFGTNNKENTMRRNKGMTSDSRGDDYEFSQEDCAQPYDKYNEDNEKSDNGKDKDTGKTESTRNGEKRNGGYFPFFLFG